MLKRMLSGFAVVLFVATPVLAAKMTAKEECLQGVADVRDMLEKGDPRLGPKTEAQMTELVEIATHLCEQGNFRYAESLLRIARTTMSSE